MSYRELTMIEVREVLRRWQAGQALREMARETGLDRKTVRRYVDAAATVGLKRETTLRDEDVQAVAQRVTDRSLPEPSEQRLALMPHRDQIAAWLEGERPLKLTKVHDLLSSPTLCHRQSLTLPRDATA